MNGLRKFVAYIFTMILMIALFIALWYGCVWAQKTWYPKNDYARFYFLMGAVLVLSGAGAAFGASSKD